MSIIATRFCWGILSTKLNMLLDNLDLFLASLVQTFFFLFFGFDISFCFTFLRSLFQLHYYLTCL